MSKCRFLTFPLLVLSIFIAASSSHYGDLSDSSNHYQISEIELNSGEDLDVFSLPVLTLPVISSQLCPKVQIIRKYYLHQQIILRDDQSFLTTNSGRAPPINS